LQDRSTDSSTSAIPTPDPLPRFLRCAKVFDGRTIAFHGVAAGKHRITFLFRYFGDGGIAFLNEADEKKYRSLSDEERKAFAERLRAIVDRKDEERYHERVRRDRLRSAMKWAAYHRAATPRPALPRPIARRPITSGGSRTRTHRVRRSAAPTRGDPSSDDDPPEPPLVPHPLVASARCWLDATGIWPWSGWADLAAEAEACRRAEQ